MNFQYHSYLNTELQKNKTYVILGVTKNLFPTKWYNMHLSSIADLLTNDFFFFLIPSLPPPSSPRLLFLDSSPPDSNIFWHAKQYFPKNWEKQYYEELQIRYGFSGFISDTVFLSSPPKHVVWPLISTISAWQVTP